MPTYEYACRSCGEHLEVVQSFKDDPLTECPACQGQLRKVFSAAGIIFKGSGWHVKDYASGSSSGSSAGSSGSEAGSGDGTGSEGKSSEGKGADGKSGSSSAGGASSSGGSDGGSTSSSSGSSAKSA